MSGDDAAPRPEPGEAVADILRASYYYALADGHAEIDPALLLMAAARNDKATALPALGAAVADARDDLKAARIGAGGAAAVPPPTVQDCSQAGAMREARWWVLRDTDDDVVSAAALSAASGGPGWSASACAALDRATGAAVADRSDRLDVSHLLTGLLQPDDPTVRALASRTGLDVAAAAGRDRLRSPIEPFVPMVDLITSFGATDEPIRRGIAWIPRLMARMVGRDNRLGGPVLAGLELEVMRQAIVTGTSTVQSSAILLALLSADDQLAAAGRQLKAEYAPHNRGGALLTDAGAGSAAARFAAEGGVTEEGGTMPAERAASRFWSTGKPGDPSWGLPAVRVLDRAGEIARERGHADIGTSHCLAALLPEPPPAAAAVLARLGVDVTALSTTVEADLARG